MSLNVVNLSKKYRDKWILRDISFDVAPGEVFGISGPSGAGKTTLLSAIAGNESFNGGSVLHNGTDVTALDRRTWLWSPEPAGWGLKRLFGSPCPVVAGESLRSLSGAAAKAHDVLLVDE